MFCSLQLIVRNCIIEWSDDNGDEMTLAIAMKMVMFNMMMTTKMMMIIIIKMTRTMTILNDDLDDGINCYNQNEDNDNEECR